MNQSEEYKRAKAKASDILVKRGLMYNYTQMFGDDTINRMCGGIRSLPYERLDNFPSLLNTIETPAYPHSCSERYWFVNGKKFNLVVYDCGNGWYQLVRKIRR
jgi:hypothetical protein